MNKILYGIIAGFVWIGLALANPPGTYQPLLLANSIPSTWNPADKNAATTLSNANLTAAANTTSIVQARAITGRASGKFYWEEHYDSGNATVVMDTGVCNGSASLATYPGGNANSWGYYANDGNTYNNGVSTGSFTAYGIGDTIMHAVDISANKWWTGKNGTWQNSGNPASGTGAVATNLSGTIYPCTGLQSGISRAVTATVNFGATTFTYTVPTGFNAGWFQ